MPPSQSITTLIDQEIIKTLVKEHIKEEPCMQTCLWKCGDPEVVVEAYKGFLVACAEENVRISHLVLAKAMGKIFTTNATELQEFARILAEALKHCRKKSGMVTTGKKTAASVFQVIQAYPGTPSPSPSPSPSRANSPTTTNKKFDKLQRARSMIKLEPLESEIKFVNDSEQEIARADEKRMQQLFGKTTCKSERTANSPAVSVCSSAEDLTEASKPHPLPFRPCACSTL